jgi:hypothetical protein
MDLLLNSKYQEQRFKRIFRRKKADFIKANGHLTEEQLKPKIDLLFIRTLTETKTKIKNERIRRRILNDKLKAKGISTTTEIIINRKQREEYLKARQEERNAFNSIIEETPELIADIPDRER